MVKQKKKFSLTGKVHLYPGQAGWHFLPLPKKESATIKADFGAKSKGWGSLKVRVKMGQSAWDTSIFYDSRGSTYLLPLKAAIRHKEGLEADDTIDFDLEIRV